MGENFQLRLAGTPDIDGILYVMEQVKECMEHPKWFVADDQYYIERHAAGIGGFTVMAETEGGQAAAFFTIDYPGDREDNLGYDIGLSEEECQKTAHMDSVGVLPQYRGNHLMERLLQYAQEQLSATGYRHLMCTVHPDNRYSLQNMERQGYQVVATKEKYGGLMRHILYKKLSPKLCGSGKPAVLVSACLLGVNCRYNGGGVLDEGITALMQNMTLIPVCPEIMGGLATPRDPAERIGTQVITCTGADVTKAYEKGAEETLKLARLYGCRCAVLKERSPSCGSGAIYDGTYSKTLVPGSGVASALLELNGIRVFGESKTEDLERFYRIEGKFVL